ncbi:hypothetical protein [Thermoleptolyngbya sp.]
MTRPAGVTESQRLGILKSAFLNQSSGRSPSPPLSKDNESPPIHLKSTANSTNYNDASHLNIQRL